MAAATNHPTAAEINSMRAMARGYSVEAVETVVGIMRDKKLGAQWRLKAAEIILERGFGRPALEIDMNVNQAVTFNVAVPSYIGYTGEDDDEGADVLPIASEAVAVLAEHGNGSRNGSGNGAH